MQYFRSQSSLVSCHLIFDSTRKHLQSGNMAGAIAVLSQDAIESVWLEQDVALVVLKSLLNVE